MTTDPGLVVIQQTRHRCEYCKRSWVHRSQAQEHVRRGCVVDPATRACKTCVHFDGPGECAVDALPRGQDWLDPYTKNCESWLAKSEIGGGP